jgi:hypothetical protein
VNILSAMPTALDASAGVQRGATRYAADALSYCGLTTGLTATIYDCGLGYATGFPAAVRGNIALIQRGTLFFSEKVTNAMAAGACAAVIYNNASGNFQGTLQRPANWIPAVSLSQADGLALRAVLPAIGTVVAPDLSYQYLDGTSMATPHVAGAVAFAALNFPAESVAQRIQRVLASVVAVSGLADKVRTGGRLDLRRMVDADTNGLPDWWEANNFGHQTGTDPVADADHDGAGNLAEWLAGTDPTNAVSRLSVAAPRANATNGFAVSWPSVQGKYYRLERSTNLLLGFTQAVRTNIAASAPTNTEIDAAADAPRFYRVLLEP